MPLLTGQRQEFRHTSGCHVGTPVGPTVSHALVAPAGPSAVGGQPRVQAWILQGVEHILLFAMLVSRAGTSGQKPQRFEVEVGSRARRVCCSVLC